MSHQSVTPKTTPSKELGIIPIAITPPNQWNKDMEDKENCVGFEKVFEESLTTEDQKTIIGYRTRILKHLDLDDEFKTENSSILSEIQRDWKEIFPMDISDMRRFQYLEKTPGQLGHLFYLVPYVNYWISVNFPTDLKLFPRFVSAMTFGVWLTRTFSCDQTGNEDAGFLLYQSLHSLVGNRLVTKFFNWFTQYLADNQRKFEEWAKTITVSDQFFYYASNSMGNESVLSEFITVGYLDFVKSEPLPLTRAKTLLSEIYGNRVLAIVKGRYSIVHMYNDHVLKQHKIADTGCKIRDELLDIIGTRLIQEGVYDSDPTERAKCRGIWSLAILLVVVDSVQSPRPRCLRDHTTFYNYIAAKTELKTIQYFKSLSKGNTDDGSRSRHSNSNDGGNAKRQRSTD